MNHDVPMLDVRLLASFVAVAELRHFGKAAEAVHATQPGVSQHINKLESVLGVRLIERTKRSVELTPAGESAVRQARIVLTLLKKMRDDSRRVAAGEAGKLKVGMSSSVIYTDLPARLATFRKDHPDVELQLRVQSGDQLKPLLEYGELDVALTTLPMAGSDYLCTVVSMQEMGVALPAGHPLANRRQLRLGDLREQPFIVVPRDQHPQNHDALVAGFHAIGATLRVAAYDTSFQNVLARVAIGEGAALVPMAYKAERAGEVHVVKLQDATLSKTPVHLVALRHTLAPVTERFVAALTPAAARAQGAGRTAREPAK